MSHRATQPEEWQPQYPRVYRKGLSVDEHEIGPEVRSDGPAWWSHVGNLAMQGLPDELARLRGQFTPATEETEVGHD